MLDTAEDKGTETGNKSEALRLSIDASSLVFRMYLKSPMLVARREVERLDSLTAKEETIYNYKRRKEQRQKEEEQKRALPAPSTGIPPP